MPRNWADIMEEEEGGGDWCAASDTDDADIEPPEHNDWDQLMTNFPVPGELYVHLVGYANYYSALLRTNPPPEVGEMPYLINCWKQVARSVHSPFRIQYGTAYRLWPPPHFRRKPDGKPGAPGDDHHQS